MALGATPAIAAIGIIGKHVRSSGPPNCPMPVLTFPQDNPLHTSVFPPHDSADSRQELSWLLYTCLDIFDMRKAAKLVDHDLGLLQAVDERLAAYGYLTNTGIKFIVVVDMAGRPPPPLEDQPPSQRRNYPPVVGLRDSDLKTAFRAIHQAYVRLMLNPFYLPDEREPMQQIPYDKKKAEITSKKFVAEMDRIGQVWSAGIANV